MYQTLSHLDDDVPFFKFESKNFSEPCQTSINKFNRLAGHSLQFVCYSLSIKCVNLVVADQHKLNINYIGVWVWVMGIVLNSK